MLSKELASCDPEVTLAVRMHGSSTGAITDDDDDDDEEIDAFLASLGFEFVDVHAAKSLDNTSVFPEGTYLPPSSPH